MLTNIKLTAYLKEFEPTWTLEMPQGVPPENVLTANDEYLYRITSSAGELSDNDLLSYYEKDPDKDWGDKYAESFGLSLMTSIDAARKLRKYPSLKECKGVAKICLQPKDGVLKQTGKQKSHYTWWRTTTFDKNNSEMIAL